MSTSRIDSSAVALTRSPKAVDALCKPGVSTKTNCASSLFKIPRTRVRVVCGLSETMLIFLPIKAFNKVDLPTFGRPTSETKALRTNEGYRDVGS
jgi:hypothetical protein